MASALGARRSALGARRSALGARRSALGARRSALGARRSALGARRSALGAPRSALRAPRSALGARRSALGAPRLRDSATPRLREGNCTTLRATHSALVQTGTRSLPQRQAGAIQDDHSFLPGAESWWSPSVVRPQPDRKLRHGNRLVNPTNRVISMPYYYCVNYRLGASQGVFLRSVDKTYLVWRNRVLPRWTPPATASTPGSPMPKRPPPPTYGPGNRGGERHTTGGPRWTLGQSGEQSPRLAAAVQPHGIGWPR